MHSSTLEDETVKHQQAVTLTFACTNLEANLNNFDCSLQYIVTAFL